VLRKGELLAQGPLEDVVAAAISSGHRIEVASSEVEATLRILEPLRLGELTVDGAVVSTTKHSDNPSQISRALANEGIYVRQLRTERATLEAAFLKIIEKADSGAGA